MAAPVQCSSCLYVIQAEDQDRIEREERVWHETCFACFECSAALTTVGGPIYERDRHLYCEVCYVQELVESLGFDGTHGAYDPRQEHLGGDAEDDVRPLHASYECDDVSTQLALNYSSIFVNPVFDTTNLAPALVWDRLPFTGGRPPAASESDLGGAALAVSDRSQDYVKELRAKVISHRIGQSLIDERVRLDDPSTPLDAAAYADKHAGSFQCTLNMIAAPDPVDVSYYSSEYAPRVFARIRHLFNIDDDSYRQSMCDERLTGGGFGAGKSGSLFYFSRDRRYVIKTIAKAELVLCLKWLDQYYEHLGSNPNTLLPRFFGMYKITIGKNKPLRFVVMNNVMYTKLKMQETYDLKGSTCDRFVKPETAAAKGIKVWKDLNLEHPVMVGPNKTPLMRQLQRDVAFMRRNNIMDYSLLLGIYRPDGVAPDSLRALNPAHFESDWQRCEGGLRARTAAGEERDEIYYLGIVDILQAYNLKKKAEHKLKIIKNKGDKQGMSAVNTDFYARRFVAFMYRILADDDDDTRNVHENRVISEATDIDGGDVEVADIDEEWIVLAEAEAMGVLVGEVEDENQGQWLTDGKGRSRRVTQTVSSTTTTSATETGKGKGKAKGKKKNKEERKREKKAEKERRKQEKQKQKEAKAKAKARAKGKSEDVDTASPAFAFD